MFLPKAISYMENINVLTITICSKKETIAISIYGLITKVYT